MAVFGPVTALALFAGFALIAGRSDKPTTMRELWLLSFIVPPMVVILGQEILSRAHANWAAAAYPAASVLLASWIGRMFGKQTGGIRAGPFIKGGVALNLIVGVVFAMAWVFPAIGDAAGASNAYKRVRGWEQTADDLAVLALEHGATALVFDEREVWHGVDYYGRGKALPPVRAWRRTDHPRSHAEEAGALRPGEDTRALVASLHPDFRPRIRADFDAIDPVETLNVPLGPRHTRQLKLYLASGYRPRPRTAAYEAEFAGQRED
jgi:hypothetical protein